MAIIAINEVKAQCQADLSSNAIRNYTRILQLISNDPQDMQVTVLYAVMNHLGLVPDQPAAVIFSVGNDVDPGAYLNKITVRQDTSKKGEYKNWEARLEYTSQLEQLPDNPLLRPTIVSGGFQMYQKTIEKDIFGQPILNTAGGKLEGIEIDDPRPHCTMTRNESAYNWAFFAANYVNYVNIAPFYGAFAYQVKCSNVAGQGPNFENGVMFYTVTYEFQFRLELWSPLSFLNRGRKNKDGTPCTDANGNEMDEPALLDNNGKQLPWPVNTTNATFIKPVCYYPTDFNTLGLP